MSNKTLNISGLQIRGDSSTNFKLKNPVLKARELVYETDTKKLKIGDGATFYNSLEYLNDIEWKNLTEEEFLALWRQGS